MDKPIAEAVDVARITSAVRVLRTVLNAAGLDRGVAVADELIDDLNAAQPQLEGGGKAMPKECGVCRGTGLSPDDQYSACGACVGAGEHYVYPPASAHPTDPPAARRALDALTTLAESCGAEIDGGDHPDYSAGFPGSAGTITFTEREWAAFARALAAKAASDEG